MMLPPMKVSTGATVIICTDRAAKPGTPEYDMIARRQCRVAYDILIAAVREKAESEQRYGYEEGGSHHGSGRWSEPQGMAGHC